LRVRRSVAKDLRGIPEADVKRIAACIEGLRDDRLENLALLTGPAKAQLVMKDGAIHSDWSTPVPSEAALHLPGADRPLQEEGVKEALASRAN
jgi:hypothetical protein